MLDILFIVYHGCFFDWVGQHTSEERDRDMRSMLAYSYVEEHSKDLGFFFFLVSVSMNNTVIKQSTNGLFKQVP